MIKVFLTGSDNINWATDDDFSFTKKAISPFAEITENINDATIIHSVNWTSLLSIDSKLLTHRYVVAHIPHDFRHLLRQPEYLRILPFVNRWMVLSRTSESFIEKTKLPYSFVPYYIDKNRFFPFSDTEKVNLKKKYNLPCNKYLIGSFQRDTEGSDLKSPKLIKGPDVFLEIVKRVYLSNNQIHVVLAGPRRFWLMKQLQENDIPFSYVGNSDIVEDDIMANTLNHQTINELSNAVDLYIVSSRLEGGPKAILECAASRTKIISTPVGQAGDVLNKKQLFTSVKEATSLIEKDINNNYLAQYTDEAQKKLTNHSLEKISGIFLEIYNNLSSTPSSKSEKPIKKIPSRPKVSIIYKTRKTPWGGANQFFTALGAQIKRQGFKVSTNANSSNVLFNSFHFADDFVNQINTTNQNIIHRIDGPTFLIRGRDLELDEKLFKLNNDIADCSIFQSDWSFFETLKLGFNPVNPVIITNAADSRIFNRIDKIPFSNKRKTRLIASSWSNNPRKGAATYEWIDKNLDWTKYEFTFVGNIDVQFKNIKVIPPCKSKTLAKLLKNHDIYIAASINDPCSNALIEALSCGLPVLYKNSGGHPEIVGFGGLGFDNNEDIISSLEELVLFYESYKNLIAIPSIRQIADKYLQLFGNNSIWKYSFLDKFQRKVQAIFNNK